MLDQVEAVALQLVTNAVLTTGAMDEHVDLTHVDYLSAIVVGLRQTEDAVVVEIWDSSSDGLRAGVEPVLAGSRTRR